ncbi:MAG: GHMP kinase [Planctomycetes bacterium RBG_16_43_13]|nr:MAG: GHMP kinase [Planctomycetes bacterium RBG_16_43_13]
MIIRSRAPLRISFAGGGTDVSPYCDEKGGAVLNATFNKYVHTTLVPNKTGKMGLHSEDYQTSVSYDINQEFLFDGNLDLIKACINKLYIQRDHGFDIYIHTDAPPGSGVGASSALVVAVLGAFREWLRLPYSDYELAELAFEIERVDLGIQGGQQDQYAASLGGINFLEFSDGRTIVNSLRILPSVVSELEERLALCYIGGSRMSAGIINDQMQRYRDGEQQSLEAFDETKALAIEAKKHLLSGEIDDFAKVIDRAWNAKKNLSTKISNPFIDVVYSSAISSGAIGGKITGAGGGGYMFFICQYDKKKDVIEAIRKYGCQLVDFSFEANGVRAWRVSEKGIVR